uniref:HTH myb-type domain-containing protein n=1 Tax=Physcomitrium patens TaxID=3218 RepID=A0A2K1KTU6_PHYPA|nr:hypothetical protein PHYPA_004173 [Physcomitrium patens]
MILFVYYKVRLSTGLKVHCLTKLGNKWAKIASCLHGRIDNDVKNFWSTRQKRILRALQRPKMPSGSIDASTDTQEFSLLSRRHVSAVGGQNLPQVTLGEHND